ncbi:MAG: hypothetical protein GX796_07765 [Clostridiaceae bacterium]|nr:hypothetical protein [Clostridiaceae bacterium]
MNLIERYLYAIKKYLPEEIREDAGKELRANIEDMLPVDYTDDDVYQVLMNLGSPRKLANEYNSQKRYLIGPGYYDNYISVLKKVIGMFVSVALSIAFLVWIVESPAYWYQVNNITKLFVNLITSGIAGVMQSALWVTIVFIILERTEVEVGYIPFFNKKWTPNDLPELPVDEKMRISRGETVFSMFFTILVTALLYFRPQLIALFRTGENGSIDITPLLDIDRLQFYIPVIIVLALVQLGMFIWKFIAEIWSLPLAILNAVYYAAICILVIMMLIDHALVNPEFISVLSSIAKVPIETVSAWIIKGKLIFGFAFIGMCAYDSARTLLRCISKPK